MIDIAVVIMVNFILLCVICVLVSVLLERFSVGIKRDLNIAMKNSETLESNHRLLEELVEQTRIKPR